MDGADLLAPAFVEGYEGPGDLRAQVAEDDFGGGVDAGARGLRGRGAGGSGERRWWGEVAVGLELAQAAAASGRAAGCGASGRGASSRDPGGRAGGLSSALSSRTARRPCWVTGEKVEEGAVGGGEGGDLGVDGGGEQVRVELGEVAAEVVFEPALGLDAEKGVSLVGGGGGGGR